MHGHDFVILKTGYPEYNKTSSLWDTPNSDLECPDKKMCRKMRWTKDQYDYQLDSNQYPVTVKKIKIFYKSISGNQYKMPKVSLETNTKCRGFRILCLFRLEAMQL